MTDFDKQVAEVNGVFTKTPEECEQLAEKVRGLAVSEPLDLEAIKKRAEAATPGPWDVADKYDKEQSWPWVIAFDGDAEPWWVAECAIDITPTDGVDNAQFIAHARSDVPALVAEVEKLRGRLEAEFGEGGWQ